MIYLFLFLLPIQLGTFFFLPQSYIGGIRIDYLAPALYLTDVVTIILIVLNHKLILKTPFLKNLGNWSASWRMVIMAIIVVNITFAIEPLIALYRVLKILEVLAIFIIVKNGTLHQSQVLGAFFWGAVVQFSLVLFQVTQGHSMQGLAYFLGERAFSLSTPGIAKVSLQGVEILRGYGTFPHPNALAGFYLVLYTYFLFLKSHIILQATSHKLQAAKPLFLALSTLLILFSFSKIAIATLVIITILFVIHEKYDCLLCGFSKVTIPLFLALIVFSTQGDTESIQKRVYLAQSSLTIIKEHLLTGVGMGNYLYAQAAFPIPYNYVFLQPVHNIFLLMVAEFGILPIIIGVYYLARISKFYRPTIQEFSILNSQFSIIVVLIITGMFDHYWLTIQQNLLLIPVVFGLLQRHDHVVK